MITQSDKNIILKCAEKYHLTEVILFGSAKDQSEFNDIDLGVNGASSETFFELGWELLRDLSKPVDVIDLSEHNSFNDLVRKQGVLLYG